MDGRAPTTVRLSEEEREYLRERAEAEDRTMSSQLRHLIRQDRRDKEKVK